MSGHLPSLAVSRYREPIVDPELPIVDAHHHFLLNRAGQTYLLPDLLSDAACGHKIIATVYVECGSMYRTDGPEELRPVGEVEFAARETAGCGATGLRACAGIIGYADLRRLDVLERVFDALDQAGDGRMRGIRQAAAWDDENRFSSRPDRAPHLLADPRFRKGFAKLAGRRHVYEAWLYHPQIPELTDLARAFPDTTIVLDHVGGIVGTGTYAGKWPGLFPDWKRSILDLARCQNVVVKLGGLGMPLCGFGFDKRERPASSDELAAAWRPFIETCIEAFGVERCMFESNAPVDSPTCNYLVLWNALKKIAAGCSAEEKTALFRATAERVYRLSENAGGAEKA